MELIESKQILKNLNAVLLVAKERLAREFIMQDVELNDIFKVDFKNNAAEAVGNLESMFEVMAKNTDKQQDKAVKTLAAQLAKITGQMVDNYNALMSRIAELDKLVGKNGGRG